MRTDTPKTISRTDYQPPVFRIETVEMAFDLDPDATVVATRTQLVRNRPGVLQLNGENLELLFVTINGKQLGADEYLLAEHTLSIPDTPDVFTLDIAVRIRPSANTSLMGLYVSNGNFFTQCEAEGFRKITYFPDRPDVMAKYTVMLRADRENYPVLLSNGNLIEEGDLGDGRHYAKWEDPFLKPSYLFALVAGKLAHVEKRIRSASGKEKLLQIYVEKRDLEKVGHAMNSLTDSIRWDEKRFGLELDLDRFMIVAVGDFNMGAMENKGLNIFNTKYVLASPETATDVDFGNIEAVVGHEYFHNWTGDRVTCRDWFQLTLKEGLTVFRDQEFSADMSAGYLDGRDLGAAGATARAVKRIDDVRTLRTAQFPEDAGPMAHPIRPESYQEISNFYTVTVYEKGAEVVRMLQTLLGRDGFRAGMDEYFRRHDGQAVTCDDFVAAMESVYKSKNPGKDLSVFRRWYAQAGTPRVYATTQHDPKANTFTLTLRQITPHVGVEALAAHRAGKQSKNTKLPFHIPFAIGLLDADGKDLPLRLQNEFGEAAPETTRVLDFTEAEQKFVFTGVPLSSGKAPVASLLRNFSAPVIVEHLYDDADLAQLSAHDSDPFNRWEAGQRLAVRELVRLAKAMTDVETVSPVTITLNPALVEVYRATLSDPALDPALKEQALTLPAENVVGEELAVYDPQAVHAARDFARKALAESLRDAWLATYKNSHTPGPYSPDPLSAGKRALKNCALSYLVETGDPAFQDMAWKQFKNADNMTDRLAAFTILVNSPAEKRSKAIRKFYKLYKSEALVVDKWLRTQAGARRVRIGGIETPVLESVQALMQHKAFSLRNPNKVYALLSAFFNGNPAEFHLPDGSAYAFWVQQVLALDAFNPQVASRIGRALDRWRKLPSAHQKMAQAALQRVHDSSGLSKDLAEVISKALNAQA